MHFHYNHLNCFCFSKIVLHLPYHRPDLIAVRRPQSAANINVIHLQKSGLQIIVAQHLFHRQITFIVVNVGGKIMNAVH